LGSFGHARPLSSRAGLGSLGAGQLAISKARGRAGQHLLVIVFALAASLTNAASLARRRQRRRQRWQRQWRRVRFVAAGPEPASRAHGRFNVFDGGGSGGSGGVAIFFAALLPTKPGA